MNLIDENYSSNNNSKKILTAGIIAIIVLILIIVGLLAYVSMSNNNKVEFIVENKKYSASNYLMQKDNLVYVGIEDLTKITNNGYNFKTGGRDVEDESQCYITNSYESTFFKVNSKSIYKVLEDTDEVEFYELEGPIIKENGKFYMPISASKIAMNVAFSSDNNKYNIRSIAFLEGIYNKDKSNTFEPDTSIVWENTYSNKKLLKEGLVITKDSEGKYGVSKVSSSTDSKSKVTSVKTSAIITPKYDEIKYVEKYNQLIVSLDKKKGIIQLSNKDGAFSAETIVKIQFEDIKPIYENLFLISETKEQDGKKIEKYGVIKSENGKEETILANEYDEIGIDFSKFTNNDLNSQYVLYDSLIPVKKGNLWGLVNLKGNVVVKIEYSELGDTSSNPNSNVLIIPEVDGIVVKKDGKYGVVTKTNRSLIGNIASKIYKETINGKEQYSMIYNNKTSNVVEYIKKTK